MKQQVKFQFIDEYTHLVKTKVFDYLFPDFKVKYEFFQGEKYEISIEEQMMEHLDSVDKIEFMNKNGMSVILDYSIYHKKPRVSEKESFIKYLKDNYITFGITEKLLIDLLQYASKSKTIFGKRKSNYQKLMEIMDGLNLSYQAVTANLRRLEESYKNSDEFNLTIENNGYDTKGNTTMAVR